MTSIIFNDFKKTDKNLNSDNKMMRNSLATTTGNNTTTTTMSILERLTPSSEPEPSRQRRRPAQRATKVKTTTTTTTAQSTATGISSSSSSPKLHILLAITTLITMILSERALLIDGGASNHEQQHDSVVALQRPDPSGRPQLMVAVYCPAPAAASGQNTKSTQATALYHNQYLDVESRKWRSDRSNGEAVCTHDKQAILAYCKKVYPTHDIRNIVESSRPYKLDNWCRVGASGSKRRACRARLTVRPYRCLEGTFQSDALLVPEKCVFDHVHNKSVCEPSDKWNKSAGEICHSKSMRLQSFGMLQPCGLDVFSGVEFVCCPASTSSSSSTTTTSTTTEGSNSFAQAAAAAAAAVEANEIKTTRDESEPRKAAQQQQGAADSSSSSQDSSEPESDTGASVADDEDEYDEETATAEEDEDGYDDDSSSWSPNGGDKSASTTSTTSTTTTTTTTTTTERPIERYLSHFDLAHEHDDFRRAELAVEASYKDKITHVMREWSQLDGRYEEMKRSGQVQAAEEFKRKMTRKFQKTVEALEAESAAQRHQLASMHAERAMAIINRRKKAAMDCLTQALDRVPTRPRQVERCISRLLKALEKDRTHTLRQYRNLLNLNTRDALHERKIILDHLVTLNRAASQSITMLDRSPLLVEKLKGKIMALWHKLRGVPLDEPIVRESEEKIMDQLEEEAAQRKIERERKRLAEQERLASLPVSSSETSTSGGGGSGDQLAKSYQSPPATGAPVAPASASTTTSTTTTSTSTTTTTERPIEVAATEARQQQQPDQQPLVQVISESVGGGQDQASLSHGSGSDATNKDARTHYQTTDPVGFAHLRMEAPYHELSYSVRHEPLQGHMRFGYTTLLASSFAAVILLAFIGVKYYGKNSTRAYRRQGFNEVGRSCPEEKNVTHMQFNGYENPAYKFFEAEA